MTHRSRSRSPLPALGLPGLPVLIVLAAIPAIPPAPAAAQDLPPLERYAGGFFSIERPRGWQVIVAGQCTTFAFVLRDPARPARQVFYFSSVGPFTKSQQQRQIDLWYTQNQGYPIPWIEFPVVEPATPGNFMANWQGFADSPLARQFMPGLPRLATLIPVHDAGLPSPFDAYGGTAGLVRGVFSESGEVAEGLFTLTLVPESPFMNGPGGDTGRVYMLTGITAPKAEFGAMTRGLTRIARSLRMDESYVQRCVAQLGQEYGAVMRAGQTLRESSDIITRGWEARQRSQDIMAEKYADAVRGTERLYDPATGEVYEFPEGFYERYSLNPNAYRRANLEPLPDNDHGLWSKAPLDGPRHVM